MTLPNRPGYVPGQQRRERKCAVVGSGTGKCAATSKIASASAKHHVAASPMEQGTQQTDAGGDLQEDLQAMLAALSPVPSPKRGLQSLLEPPTAQFPLSSGLTKEELKKQAERRHKSLREDPFLRDNPSCRRLLTFTSVPVHQVEGADPFLAAIELLPPVQRECTMPTSLGASSFGHDAQEEFLLAQNMNTLVEDPVVRARYQQASQQLQEWCNRRVQQQLQQCQPGSDGNASPAPSPLSLLSSSSPYVLELTTRNGVPKKRTNLSKTAKVVLRHWFEENLHHPYPTEEEKDWLAAQGGITMEQVNNWFINTRGRKWKPMLTRLMAEKQAGDCKLYDQMVERIEQPYRRDI